MSKVTIGIPFYNNESVLQYAINSVLNQTYKDWKLILIDDGSTDRSLQIAKQFESEKVKVISDSVNKGLIARLNQLIDLTDTEYFVRMDSDDIMTPDRLEKQVHLLSSNPSLELVGSFVYTIDENNSITGKRGVNLNVNRVEDILKNGLFIHPTVTGKTSWFKKNNYKLGFNRAEDLELWCRSYDGSTRFYSIIEEPLLFYRDPVKLSIDKYRASSKTVRKIIRLYATNNFVKAKLIIRELLKVGIYILLEKINFDNKTHKLRNKRLEMRDEKKAYEILNKSIN
jgi:glycosyltransferase involved in cell wall biosynthesis